LIEIQTGVDELVEAAKNEAEPDIVKKSNMKAKLVNLAHKISRVIKYKDEAKAILMCLAPLAKFLNEDLSQIIDAVQNSL
jgi:hypothetical protein